MILDVEQKSSWSFVYSKAQSEVGPQPKCTNTCQSPSQAFVGGEQSVWEKLEEPADFVWKAVSSTAQPECSFCAELFNETLYDGPLVPEPAVYDTVPSE